LILEEGGRNDQADSSENSLDVFDMTKRNRGRPNVDDDATLQAAAMKLARGEVVTPRSAIAQSLPARRSSQSFDSDLRRVQRKWRKAGEALLARARDTIARQKRDQAEADRRIERELFGHGYGGLSSALTAADVARELARSDHCGALAVLARQPVEQDAWRMSQGFTAAEEARRHAERLAEAAEPITERIRREIAALDRIQEMEKSLASAPDLSRALWGGWRSP
jgi:hypothetical protein